MNALNTFLNLLARTEGRDKVYINIYRLLGSFNLLVFIHFNTRLRDHQHLKYMNKSEW